MSGKHFLLGPSSLPRILNCIGSLYGPAAPDKPSPAAEEGTTCHSLLEFCLSFGVSPRDCLGSTDFNAKFPITIEMVEGVELFLDTLTAVCTEFGIPSTAVVSEQQLVHRTIPNQMFGGTADCIAAHGNTLVVMDLKYGHKQVFADSEQLTAYSLLALDSLGEQANEITNVVQIIVQPRGNPQVSRHVLGQNELFDVWNKITQAASFVLANPDMSERTTLEHMKAGDWCKYCRRKEGCPARQTLVTEFVELGTFVNPNDMSLIASPTSDLSTEVLVDWKKKFDVIKDFMKGVETDLKNRAAKGETIPGFKLVLDWTNRQYVETDEEKLRKKIPRVFKGVTAKDIMEQSLVSVAKLEKVLKSKDLWKQFKDKFNELVTTKPKGVKLVDARSKGEEVRPETALELLNAMIEETPDE